MAGSLSVGYWDHWVPGANTAMTQICEEWAEKEKVNLTIDYLSTQGNKLYLTIAAEALAKSGHDIMDLSAWEPSQYASQLEPVEDVMTEVLARNGPVNPDSGRPTSARDASNNKFLVSSKGALLFKLPSACAVAKRDNPKVAEKGWTHAMPKGPKGRFVSTPRFQGLWNFSKNKSTAKSPMAYVATRSAAEKLVDACRGLDLPPFVKFNDIKTWDEQTPPNGTLSHYPNKGEQEVIVPCAPAPPAIAAQIDNQHAEDDPARCPGRARLQDARMGVPGDRGFQPQLKGMRCRPGGHGVCRASPMRQAS